MSVVAFGVKVPPVADDQVPPVAAPPTVPTKPAVLLPAQIVWLAPAMAVATGWIVIVIVEVTASQGPTGSLLVKVTVAVPAAIWPAVGV